VLEVHRIPRGWTRTVEFIFVEAIDRLALLKNNGRLRNRVREALNVASVPDVDQLVVWHTSR
jgi:hypothetical protein